MKSSNGIPDLLILHPNDKYHGLFIELKKDADEIYTKKGILRNEKHIIEQNEMLEKLCKIGYLAVFGCGFENTKKIIYNYFSNI